MNLCAGVTCTAPPAPFCETATLAVRYTTPGTCIDGTCDYARQPTDCAATGRECRGGSCVDPCVGVTCTPPANACEGDTRVVYSGGACESGACRFTQTRTDCRTLGQVCQNGACFDPCDDVTCTPPAPFCDGNVAVTTELFRCELGVCRYLETYRTCAFEDAYCLNGLCVPGDPCTGVDCTVAPYCEGDVRISFPATGDCLLGACVLDPEDAIRVDCFDGAGLACIGGECVALPDPTVGDLVVSELSPLGQGALSGVAWFEITNRSNRRVRLNNALVRDNGNRTRTLLAGGSSIGPGEHRAFAITTTPAALVGTSLENAVVWTPSQLSVGATGTLSILNGATVLSSITWDATWPFAAGRSAQLSEAAREDQLSNPVAWCRTWAPIDSNNLGSPGAPNNNCTPITANNASLGMLRLDEYMAQSDASQPTSSWWVEVFNLTNQPVEIAGLPLVLGSQRANLPAATSIPPHSSLVLAATSALLPPAVPRVSVGLASGHGAGAGAVALLPLGATDTADAVAVLSWGSANAVTTTVGQSWQRDGVHDIDIACFSRAPIVAGQRATPSTQNFSCLGAATCTASPDCTQPANTCDGNELARLTGSGVCTPLGCDYTAALSVEDCPTDGHICVNGACVPPAP